MFRDRLKKLLFKENPLDNDVPATHVEPVEITIEAHGAKADEMPDFLSMFDKKELTELPEDGIMDDDDKLEMKALKMLIERYKREK
jgi:hypothetical protein